MTINPLRALEAGDNCEFFRQQRDYEASQLRRTNQIMLLLSVCVAACTVVLLVSATSGKAVSSIAGGLGTVMSGGAIAFLLNERTNHQQRIDQWVTAIEAAHCPDA